MIVDIHVHVGKDRHGESYDIPSLLADMKANGIDRSVVFPFSTDPTTDMVQASLHLIGQDERLIPFLRFDPNNMDVATLQQLLEKPFKGVKIHPKAQHFIVDDPVFFPLYEVIMKKKIPLLIHCMAYQDMASPQRIIGLCDRFPELNIIMAHFFGGHVGIIKDCVKPNLFVDTSIAAATLKIKYAMDIGVQLVLGSDVPYDTQKVAKLKIEDAGLTEEQKYLVYEGNARKLGILD